MIIYMVCEWIDLGYHAESSYRSKEKAEARCKQMNDGYNKIYDRCHNFRRFEVIDLEVKD